MDPAKHRGASASVSAMSSDGKCLVMCARAPPQVGGTPTVMYELLRHFPKDSVVLISKAQAARHSADNRTLDVEHHQIAGLSKSAYHGLFQLALMPLMLVSVVRLIKTMRVRPLNMLAVFPSLDFLSVSLMASKLARIPVFVYMHDCILETATNPVDKTLARLVERYVFSHARKVYCMSEPMQDYLKTRSFEADVLPHGVDSSLIRAPKHPSGDGSRVRVGFAGGVYETNLGAVEDLIEAKSRSRGGMELHVRGPRQSLDLMRSKGLRDKFDSIETLGRREEVLDFLSSCDVLVVPMSFESKMREDLLTIFPTKVTDYWLAQRPILVYGPTEYAFVVKSARDGYARAVSVRDPDTILKAVYDLSGSSNEAESLVQASRAAIARHDGRTISRKLMDDLGVS